MHTEQLDIQSLVSIRHNIQVDGRKKFLLLFSGMASGNLKAVENLKVTKKLMITEERKR